MSKLPTLLVPPVRNYTHDEQNNRDDKRNKASETADNRPCKTICGLTHLCIALSFNISDLYSDIWAEKLQCV